MKQLAFSNKARFIPKSIIERSNTPSALPGLKNLLLEGRTAIDLAKLPYALTRSFTSYSASSNTHQQQSTPVILFPAFGCDEKIFYPLRLHLRNRGYATYDWGLGKNLAGVNLPHQLDDLSDNWHFDFPENYDIDNYAGEAGVAYLCDQACKKIETYFEQCQQPVVLIGWSLGGYIAREVARALPSQVKHVITMGAPIIGGPKHTLAGKVFTAKGYDIDWIAKEVAKKNALPLEQSVTTIFSKSDGIVSWEAAVDKRSPMTEHWEVDCAHLGMGINRQVWTIVEQSLEKFA